MQRKLMVISQTFFARVVCLDFDLKLSSGLVGGSLSSLNNSQETYLVRIRELERQAQVWFCDVLGSIQSLTKGPFFF
jgi:hypothetical protein